MKFYFCQGCGRRITEKDIAAGEGRDKKLRGVYCPDCAVGITTMDSLPLTDQQARGVLEEERASQVERKSRSRIPSSSRTAAGRKSSRSRISSKDIPSVQGGAKSWAVPVASGIGGVLVCVLLAWMLFAQDGKSEGRKKKAAGTKRGHTSKAETPPDREPRDEPPSKPAPDPDVVRQPEKRVDATPPDTTKQTTPNPKPRTPPRTVPQPPPARETSRAAAEARAREAFDELKRRLDVLSAFDFPRRTSALEAFLRDHGESKAAVEARARMATVRAQAAAMSGLTKYIKEVEAAVGKGDFKAAVRIGEKAKVDPALKPREKQARALASVAETLLRGETAREAALKALLDGKERSVPTRKKTIKGVIRKVEGDTLSVRVRGSINKQVVEYVTRVRFADLTPAGRADLLGQKSPETPDEWVGEVVRKVAAADLDAAEKSLSNANAHPLADHYRSRFETARIGEKEACAKRYWQERVEPLVQARTLTREQAKTGRAILDHFLGDHGNTDFAASVAKQIAALEDRIDAVLGPKELTLDLGGGIEMRFVVLKPGTYMRGDPDSEQGVRHADSKPQHKVTLTQAFCMGKYEVTQAQFRKVMGSNPSKFRGAERPVERVNWHDCKAFCVKLSKQAGKSVRLPTEAEWEYACRAGTTTRFAFGDEDAALSEHGWWSGNANRKTHPVGQKKPNAFNIHDMHGNVGEWCRDWFAPYASKDLRDPKGPGWAKCMVIRGGSWNVAAGFCRSACRLDKSYVDPASKHPSYGFRVAMDP